MLSLLLIATCAAFAQTASHPVPPAGGQAIWEPPAWDFPRELPQATVAKEMLATLRVSGFRITLEETKMDDVKTRFGGTFGQSGEAGEFYEWLCYQGTDSKGRWALWLGSGEINGGTVGDFQWRRLAEGAVLDERCRKVQGTSDSVALPIALQLGMSEKDVLKTLGPPSARRGDTLIWLHEHQETIHWEPYTSDNTVMILLRDGVVWAIQASKTTSD